MESLKILNPKESKKGGAKGQRSNGTKTCQTQDGIFEHNWLFGNSMNWHWTLIKSKGLSDWIFKNQYVVYKREKHRRRYTS